MKRVEFEKILFESWIIPFFSSSFFNSANILVVWYWSTLRFVPMEWHDSHLSLGAAIKSLWRHQGVESWTKFQVKLNYHRNLVMSIGKACNKIFLYLKFWTRTCGRSLADGRHFFSKGNLLCSDKVHWLKFISIFLITKIHYKLKMTSTKASDKIQKSSEMVG